MKGFPKQNPEAITLDFGPGSGPLLGEGVSLPTVPLGDTSQRLQTIWVVTAEGGRHSGLGEEVQNRDAAERPMMQRVAPATKHHPAPDVSRVQVAYPWPTAVTCVSRPRNGLPGEDSSDPPSPQWWGSRRKLGTYLGILNLTLLANL